MKNIHVLQTDKPSRLQLNVNTKRLILFNNIQSNSESAHLTTQNIYITSDEEIKVGDWVLFENSNVVRKAVDSTFTSGVNNIRIHADKKVFKIILTTDQDLIKEGVQSIDDDFLEWFIKNPSVDYIKTEKWLDDEGKVIYSRTIPKEETMRNIHVLPTDKPSRLYSKDGNHILDTTMAIDWYISSAGYKPHNIYITSDEEIKEGEYGLSKLNEIIKFHSGYDYRYYAKIILTTDQDLIKDGVQAIDDEFLEWFVKNPSCEYVEVKSKVTKDGVWTDLKGYVELPTIHSISYQIIIPKEEPKQEILEEAAEREASLFYEKGSLDWNKYRQVFIEGAKWQQEQDRNKFSKEDMEQAFIAGVDKESYNGVNFDEWFEQFKKK